MVFRTSLCLVGFLLLGTCTSRQQGIGPVNSQPGEEQILKIKGISESQAVAIAESDALRTYKSLAAFKVVPCEQVLFWRIIFDNGGPEYLIDKSSGSIIRAQKIPQSSDGGRELLSQERRPIGKQEAIAIARNEALKVYKDQTIVNDFVVIVCEQAKVWRVLLDHRLRPGEGLNSLPNGQFPNYVIDKTSGEVLYRGLD
jgi:Peptidase propeptide and YPEB domain